MSGWPLTVDKWPLLISGPILRRVEPNSVSVFVALSHPRDVTLTIYDSNSALMGNVLASETAGTKKIGEHLHVVVVTATPTQPLTPGHIYGYNLSFQKGADPTDNFPANPSLDALGLLDEPHLLGYQVGRLPTFALPPNLNKLRIVYASCRLAGGEGTDAFPALDEMIGTSRADPDVRPHEFYLIGDQIYADDVAAALLAHATQIGDDALWGEQNPEKLPLRGETLTTEDARFAPTNRAKTLGEAGFSSDDGDSHLVTLGEFVGMYLLAWSDALYLSDADGTLPTIDDAFSQTRRDKWASLKDSAKSRYGATFASAVATAKSTLKVRRALANVPTYMIFDDHEVSDDWYLDQEWKDTIEGKGTNPHPLGLRVLSNALTAYAIFQAWGNDPTQFAGPTTAGGALLAELENWRGDEVAQPTVAQNIRARLNLPQSSGGSGLVWDYELLRPDYRVIFLDPRTQRDYPADESQGAALLGVLALQRQLTARLAANSRQLTIVVAQTPIFGHRFVEEKIQRDLFGTLGERKNRLKRDFESWTLNRKCFQDVIRQLSLPSHTLILSGDVHYGFAAAVDYWDEGSPLRISRIVQLTASALKKEDFFTRLIAGAGGLTQIHSGAGIPILSLPFLSLLGWIGGSLRSDSSYLAWSAPGDHLTAAGSSVNVGGSDPNLPAVQEVPVGIFGPDAIADPPEWRYRIQFVRDDRSEITRRPADAPPVPPLPTAAASYLETLRDLSEGQRSQYRWNEMRKIVGKNNLGDVTFVWSAGQQRVRQALWFTFDENALPAAAPYTIFEVSFAPPASTDPKPDLTTA